MKACGIELKSDEVVLAIAQKTGKTISDITSKYVGKSPKIKLANNRDSKKVKMFQTAIYTIFNSSSPDKIAIITKLQKGKFRSGAVSSKIEGIIQAYDKKHVTFVTPQALSKFQRINKITIKTQYRYQTEAYLLALYLLENK